MLSNLSSLTHLYFDKNKVESIEPLTGKKFTELSFKENKVKDITPLSSHTSINKLYMDNNQIEDVSILDNISISEEFTVTGQKITRTLGQDVNGDVYIELPQIFKAAKTSGNKVYTSNDLLLTNCELDSTGEKIIVNVDEVSSEVAQVKIYQGKASGTTLTITIPLSASIQYSIPSDTLTNQNVTATITFNRSNVTISNNGGKNTYTFEKNGTFEFKYYDEYGFEGTAIATVENIDKDAPVITGVENGKKYSTSVKPVIQDANLQTVVLTKDGTTVDGYKSGNVIEETGKYVLTATDKLQQTTTVSFEIDVSDVITSTSTSIIVKESNLMITGISPKTTVTSLKSVLKSEMEYKIVDEDGNELSTTSLIGTGCKIKMANDKIYKLIVPGDINGDGNVKLSDLSKLKLTIVGSQTLEGEYKEAADLNGDGNVKLSDLSKMKLYLVGKGSL